MCNREKIEELAVLYAFGLLEGEALHWFETGMALNFFDEDAMDLVRAYAELSLGLAERLPQAAPSQSMKSALMDRIAFEENRRQQPSFQPGFIMASDNSWTDLLPGVRRKFLSRNPQAGYVTFLLKMEPGASLPPHHHSGAEDCYVLEGELEVYGRRIGPGDFHHMPAGSDHQPIVSTTGGLALLVVSEEDYEF